MDEDRLREIARGAIEELAADEVPLFELQWAEALENPALLDPGSTRRDRHLGAGATTEISLVSVIVIPLVVAIGKELVSAAAKGIVSFARTWLIAKREELPPANRFSDEDIARIASVVAARFDKPS